MCSQHISPPHPQLRPCESYYGKSLFIFSFLQECFCSPQSEALGEARRVSHEGLALLLISRVLISRVLTSRELISRVLQVRLFRSPCIGILQLQKHAYLQLFRVLTNHNLLILHKRNLVRGNHQSTHLLISVTSCLWNPDSRVHTL